MSSNTLHLSHPLDLQENCSACLPRQSALPEPVLSGAKCFVPHEGKFEASSTSERAQQGWDSPAVNLAAVTFEGKVSFSS